MSTYLTAKLKLPVPNDDDPFQLGARRIRELGEAIDASTGTPWANLFGLPAGWAQQSGYPPGQYRVVDGICQLRGFIRYTTAATIPVGTSQLCNLPAVAATTNPTWLPVSSASTTSADGSAHRIGDVWISPRSDGIARLRVNTAVANNNMLCFEGCTYAVN